MVHKCFSLNTMPGATFPLNICRNNESPLMERLDTFGRDKNQEARVSPHITLASNDSLFSSYNPGLWSRDSNFGLWLKPQSFWLRDDLVHQKKALFFFVQLACATNCFCWMETQISGSGSSIWNFWFRLHSPDITLSWWGRGIANLKNNNVFS